MNNLNPEKKKLLVVGFVVTLLYSLHLAIPLYINSTLLAKYFPKENINLIYILSGIFSLFFAIYISKFVKKYHNYNTTLAIMLVDFVFTLLLGISQNIYVVGFSFIITAITISALYITLNLFIEEFSDHRDEGVVRGIFLTLLNTGILLSPLIAASALANIGFSGVYIVSAIVLIPMSILIRHYYKNVSEPKYKNISFRRGILETLRDKNIFGVMSAMFALECFYLTLVIYLPLFLLQNTNISMTTYLGVVMPFVLIPFVVLPYQMGMLADKKTGEKEFLLLGLGIISICLFLIPFIDSNSLFLWGGLLFISRVGAAILETMIFTYFFKKTEKSDAGLVALFGNMRTIATIAVPIVGAILLYLSGKIDYVFIAVALFVACTIIPASKIIDTK
jgi:MFS family permease